MAILDLTTVARVKIVDSSYDSANIDAKIQLYITSVSAKVQKFLDRTMTIGTYTEYFNPTSAVATFPVKAFPVTSITGVWNTLYEGESSPAEINSDDIQYLNNQWGYVSINDNWISSGFGRIKITYTGGMAADTSSFISSYPDIEQEVIHQVLFDMAKSQNLLDKSISIDQQETQRYDSDLIPSMKRILRHYKRKKGLT